MYNYLVFCIFPETGTVKGTMLSTGNLHAGLRIEASSFIFMFIAKCFKCLSCILFLAVLN